MQSEPYEHLTDPGGSFKTDSHKLANNATCGVLFDFW